MKRNLQLLLVILFLAIASGNLAANDSTYIHHFPYTEYINSILDMGDYLWLATDDGLVKFDKKTEKSEFFYPGQSGIPALNIKALCTDQKNNLWMSYDQGIVKFDGTKWDIIEGKYTTLPYFLISEMKFNKDNHLWISSRYFDLYEYGNVWKRHSPSSYPNKAMYISSMKIDSNDVLWLASSTLGLMRYDGENWKIYDTTNSKIPSNTVNSVAIDKEGNKWLATSRGLARLSDTGWTVWNTKNSSLLRDSLEGIQIDQKGNIWMKYKKGFTKFEKNNFIIFRYNLEWDNITTFSADSSDILWIGTTNSGLIKFDANTYRIIIPHYSKEPLIDIFSVAFDKNGIMWLGAWKSILSLDGLNCRIFNSNNSLLTDSEYRSINIDSLGNVWAALTSKVFRFNGLVWGLFDEKNSPLSEVTDIIIGKKGDVWFSKKKSLLKYDGKNWTEYKAIDSLIDDKGFIHGAMDVDESIWLITEGKLCRFFNGKWLYFTLNYNNHIYTNPLTLKIDKKGNKWIGTSRGLWKFDNNNNLTEVNNPIDSTGEIYVTCIAFDSNDTPWLGTSIGIVRFDTLSPKLYGYIGNFKTNGHIDDISFDKEGNLWFTSQRRLNVLYNDYADYPDNNIKAVNIKYQIYDGENNIYGNIVESADNFEILPGENKLSGFRPIVTFKNETKDKQLQFVVCANIYKDGEYRQVYRKSKEITSEALANPDSSGVQWVDEVGDTVYFPKDTNFKGLPPGGYVRVTFDPFVPNEIFDGHHGRMILRAFSENLSLPDSSAFPFEDQDDDTLSRVFISLNKLEELADDCSKFTTTGFAQQPSQDMWVNRGVEVADANERCYQPLNAYQMTGDYLHEKFQMIYTPVYVMNRKVGNTDVLPGKRGGDTLTSHIVDLRNRYNTTLSLSYQRSGRDLSADRGLWYRSLYGLEHRVIAPGDTLHAVREPDELIVEFISADKENIDRLINPREEDWHILPRRLGAPSEKENPPLTIFGGGGYRTALLEGDKDSILTRDNGLRADVFDDGKDDYFKIAQITIPDTVITKGGWIRFRLRVNAENNSVPDVQYEDSDNFYVDDIRTLFPCDCGENSIQSVGLDNPLPIFSLNTTNLLTPYVIAKNHTSINAPSFWIELRMKLENYPEWNVGSIIDHPMYYFSKQIPFLLHHESRKIDLPPWNITDLSEYLTPGKNVIQLWANLLIPGGDLDPSNDTLYSEQEIWFDNGIGYDKWDYPHSAVGEFTDFHDLGLSLYAHSRGDDSLSNAAGDFGGSGSGQIAMKFTLDNKDTVFGYQAYFTSFATSPDPIRFAIYKDNNGKPGELVPGSILNKDRGMDDFRKEWLIEKFSTYVYDSINPPPVLDRGTYWATIGQLGETGLQLGGQGYRAGMITTVYDSISNGNNGKSLFIDKAYREKDKSGHLVNISPWYYENDLGSGNWVAFAPETGNPGYSYLDHAGTIKKLKGSARTYSRGTFVPMLRVYMDGSHYKPTGVEDQPKVQPDYNINIFPNPVSHSAIIDYSLDIPGRVEIELINEFGESVREIFRGYKASGSHEAQFFVNDLPSGLYFLRLRHGAIVSLTKVLVIR